MTVRVGVAILACISMAFAGLYFQAASRVRTLKNNRVAAFSQRDSAVQELSSLQAKIATQEKEIAQLKASALNSLSSNRKLKEESKVIQENALAMQKKLKENEALLQQQTIDSAVLKERLRAEISAEVKDAVSQTASLKKKVTHLSQNLSRAEKEKKTALTEAYYNLGVANSGCGEYRRAVEAFEKAVAQDDTNAEAHYNAGLIYTQAIKDPAKARAHLQRYIALAPNSSDAPEVRRMLEALSDDQN